METEIKHQVIKQLVSKTRSNSQFGGYEIISNVQGHSSVKGFPTLTPYFRELLSSSTHLPVPMKQLKSTWGQKDESILCLSPSPRPGGGS